MDNVLDFAATNSSIEEEAATWMVRLDSDNGLSSAEQAQLQQWMARSAEHRDAIERLAELWGMLNILTVLAVPQDKPQQSWAARLNAALRNQLANVSRAVNALNPGRGIAAALTLALGITLYISYDQQPAFDSSNGLYQTAVGQQSTTVLSDNSRIILNTNSQVRVEYSDQGRKIVLLQGEAHFDVAKNKKIPFQVYAGDGLVQAVGTAFTVYLQQDAVVKVTVTEGKVKVLGEPDTTNQQQANGSDPAAQATPTLDLATLKAGQVGTLERVQPAENDTTGQGKNHARYLQTMQTISKPELDRQLAWHRGLVMFAGETLEQVVAEISRYSDLTINITDPNLRSLKIGGQFRIGETQAMFDVLESNFNISINRQSNGDISLASGPSH